MTEADRVFERFPDFIKEFIYSNSWEELRAVQIAAAKTIFESDNDLLLTSSTASGKTEAAFFPIITELYYDPPASIGALYIAPLKSLINDQFERIDTLLEESGIKVTHWHGDVAASHKKKLLSKPEGILQITPESLEAMLINRSNDIPRLFGDLRYVVIDEIHTLMGSDRGNQIICQLARISKLIGRSPRRIGLSATVGEPRSAADWLSAGSGRKTDIPVFEAEQIRWRLGMEHFFIHDKSLDQSGATEKGNIADNSTALDAGYEYMYDCVKDKKSLVFSNSREDTEYVCATLRQIAEKRGERDIFLIHHGNLSASLREEAEMKMRDNDIHAVTCATVTMELGIDIGKLERIVQNDAPNSVSSFLQRLGRSGRRGQPPEMMTVFREEEPLPNAPLPQLIPWGLLRAIAITQLYIEERFIEPPTEKKQPMSLLFHQTLSVLASSGELSVAELAKRVLSLPPFKEISRDDYKALIVSMLNSDMIEMTEEKGLIIGLSGERLLGSFKFYAVFNDSEDFTVRCESEEIGTITTPPPAGDRFALAGKVWEVIETDVSRRLVYVKSVEGKMEISWPGDYGEIHTRILERMKQILCEDTVYPYLKENARRRLDIARRVARATGMTKNSLVHLGGYTWCLFPWLGTRSFRTLRKFITLHAHRFGISGIEFEGCYYITFRMEKGDGEELIRYMREYVERYGIDPLTLVSSKELPVFEKYDRFVPGELLRYAYSVDKLNTAEAGARICDIYKEY
ncbi:MAG: DEAD/DEAH box helicase [Ruminococcaceae bacterium]|nr:DEAD/DEAH box helicase [Oscillospiraceae bacterium]